jgi:hypothetical protein
MPRQIFGFTEPTTPTEGFVKFATAHIDDKGDFVLGIRDRDGRHVTLEIPRAEGRQLGAELIAAASEA